LYKYNKQSAYHIYVVNVDFESLAISKEELFIKMKENGILLQLHYIPINKQPFYKQLGYGDEKTPMMDKYYNEAFTLPLFPLLSYEQQKYVVDTLLRILSKER
jgi:dTDP-4-amino-4,6-dideoxygalactose transaminase